MATVLRTQGSAITFPRSRNAIDGNLAPWTNWSYPCDATHQGLNCAIQFSGNGKDAAGACAITAKGAPDHLNASNGQACYWVSEPPFQ